MNESRQQLYLNLINHLLTCDGGEEGEILRQNQGLIDADLVLMMERVVSVLEERDAKQQGEWLQELANRLAGSLGMPLVSQRKERGVYRQVRSLERRFGKGHLYFAYHAAFPLALTPDLCYQIWANFQRDIGGNLLNIPWIAVADLFLSGLCHPVGHELYEMDLAVRNLLLKELELREDFFGKKRIEELSAFMLEYVREQINSEDEDVRDFATVQKWTALAYVKPDAAARELALTLREKVREGNKAELVRLSSVLENLAEPLREEYEPLLVYSRGLGKLARGDSEGASREFQRLGEVEESLRVSGVKLPIPRVVGDGDVFGDLALRLEWQEVSEKRRQEYLDLIELLLDCSAGEEGEILRQHQHLVDSVLLEMMREVAESLVEVGEAKAAEFLVAVADTLVEAFESAIARLVELIRSSRFEDTRLEAAKSLEEIGRGNESAIAILVKLIGTSRSDETRLLAAKSLGKIDPGNNFASAALVELIRTCWSENIRQRATEGIGEIARGNDNAIAALVELIGNYQSENSRLFAAESLGKIAGGNDNAIAALVELIGNTQSELTLREATLSLGKIAGGNENAIDALVKLIRNTESEDTRLLATESLGEIGRGNDNAIGALVELIHTSSFEVILRQAALSLGKISTDATRLQVTRTLGKTNKGNDAAIAALVQLIDNSESEDTRSQAARSLVEIGQGNKVSIAALVELINTSESEDTRLQATWSLGRIGKGSDTAIAALVELIGNTQSESTRKRAAESLGKIAPGNKTAIAVLEKLLATNSKENTRTVAAEALRQIKQNK